MGVSSPPPRGFLASHSQSQKKGKKLPKWQLVKFGEAVDLSPATVSQGRPERSGRRSPAPQDSGSREVASEVAKRRWRGG